MSTFNGIFQNIPYISVDRFDRENLNSECFFLSHCHMDHMVGLDNPEGLPNMLYVSEISAVLIRHQYPKIKDIRTLAIGVATSIDIPSGRIIVTALPAGHCPGSVMFIFETKTYRLLYTGDFRIRLKDLQKMTNFKAATNQLLKFDALYFDSTFFSKKYLEFPSQFESVKEICKLIQDWIKRSKLHIISLKIPARYGSEFLFIEIAKMMNMKIHIRQAEMEKYAYIPEMNNCVTTDPNSTQIHACMENVVKNYKALRCREIEDLSYLRVIRPSALIWSDWNKTKNIVANLQNEIYRVCYSNHSSYHEIRDMILYLKPYVCEMNVVPEDERGRAEMLSCLKEVTAEYAVQPPEINATNEKATLSFCFQNITCVKSQRHEVFSFSDDDGDDSNVKPNQSVMPPKRVKH